MGQAAKRKRERHEQEREHQKQIQAARVQWFGKLVQFDAGRGDGVQSGRVIEVSSEGVLSVECLPEYRGRVAGLVLTLNMVDRLTLVGAGE
ncbi:MAG: hypothetical protein ACRDHW_10055 [Ktedonobacteraceae bacterium]